MPGVVVSKRTSASAASRTMTLKVRIPFGGDGAGASRKLTSDTDPAVTVRASRPASKSSA